ncbi:uncharacterized protein LOC132799546 [Ziziphus jujuba]|uniref:Uncharacterized protein LOC132799546 n=1 Tax=Ziziphus jujuba TaxID=326968 RepID=A0ABM3ZT02_ZIZJJ|nr:uncharacterized protein LOC132799546 [Ziziphus jujuba]
MTVYDSDKAGNRYKGQIYFQKLCIMLPYLLRSASFYEQRPDLVDSVDEFTCELAQNTPQQSNGGDCGIFTLKTIEFLHARLPLTFTQDNMEFFRKKYAYEVYNKKLSI